MASERIQNEYDSTRIANALDTLAENLADYTPGSPVTPTDAMKAKLPSQKTTERIADVAEHLAENLTDLSNAVEITYAAYQALTPEEKSNGTTYYITDYPTLGGTYFFQTKDAMDAAIQAGTVPNNAVCMVDEDTPYVVKAEAVAYGDTNVKDELDELNSNISQLSGRIKSTSMGANISDLGIANLRTDGKPIIYVTTANEGWYYSLGRSGNIIWVKVFNYDGSLIVNMTNIPFYYYYLD